MRLTRRETKTMRTTSTIRSTMTKMEEMMLLKLRMPKKLRMLRKPRMQVMSMMMNMVTTVTKIMLSSLKISPRPMPRRMPLIKSPRNKRQHKQPWLRISQQNQRHLLSQIRHKRRKMLMPSLVRGIPSSLMQSKFLTYSERSTLRLTSTVKETFGS